MSLCRAGHCLGAGGAILRWGQYFTPSCPSFLYTVSSSMFLGFLLYMSPDPCLSVRRGEIGRWSFVGRWKVGRWKGSFVGRQNTNCKISMAHCPLPTLMHFTLGHGGSSLVRPKLQQSSELERFVLDLNKLAKLLQRCNSARHFRFKSVTVTNTWIWSLKRALWLTDQLQEDSWVFIRTRSRSQ